MTMSKVSAISPSRLMMVAHVLVGPVAFESAPPLGALVRLAGLPGDLVARDMLGLVTSHLVQVDIEVLV